MSLKLKKDKNDRTGQDIVYVDGNTYPLRSKLKSLGFSWFPARKMWYMPYSRMSDNVKKSLISLGVDISNINTSSETDNSIDNNTRESKEVVNVTNKTDFDTMERYEKIPSPKYMGFPVKRDIYNTVIKPESIEDDLKVVVDRWYVKGRRRLPKYIYTVYYGDSIVAKYALKSPGEWISGQPQFDEDSFVLDTIKKINDEGFREGTKSYRNYIDDKKVENRSDDLKQFLDYWDENKFSRDEDLASFVEDKIGNKSITINEGKYSGDFPIGFDLMNKSVIHLKTAIHDKMAPSADTLTRVEILPDIQNLEDLNKQIDNTIQNNYEVIKNKYINYLKSFPYTQQEQEASFSEMNDIVSNIGSNYNVKYFKQKLLERGLIRANRRQKQEQGGLSSVDDIKIVIDDKKIRDAVYARGSGNKPDFFYDVLAYYLMRKARNISSWSDMMLVTNISQWVSLAEKYDKDIKFNDVDKYLDKLSSMLLQDITGKDNFRSRSDNFYSFYSGFNSGFEDNSQQGYSSSNNSETFVYIATQNGIDEKTARENPKKTYRLLSMMFHPDRQPADKKQEAEKMMALINNAYSQVPQEMKVSYNWYYKSIRK